MLNRVLELQRRQLVLWWPVFFGTGCATYLGLNAEPPLWLHLVLGLVVLGPVLTPRAGVGLLMFAWAISAAAGGFTATAWRTHHVAAPILSSDMAATIEGRIIGISRSSGNNPRVLLDQVTVYGSAAQPARVRISLTGNRPDLAIKPGDRIRLHARMGAPSGPVEPYGFDFRLMAWFQQLGAVGYTTAPVLYLPEQGAGVWIELLRARQRISDGISASIDGPKGGFASAILTGDRSKIDPDTLEDLRASNLAHLLAISGMHMGMLTGFMFALVRFGLSAVPGLAARWPIRKAAAVAGIIAGLIYLILSGGAVATQRAFIMVTVILFAVLIDRPAFTLRAVALAAAIILAISPESVVGPGFQMSFAATAALVATFEWLRGQAWWRDEGRGWVTRLRPVLSLLVASTVAGAATAPISAYHFGQMSQLGLIANLLAVPLMGSVIMPAGVISALFAPFGLADVPLFVMAQGIGGVLWVAKWVAGMEGAVRLVPMGPVLSLILIGLGGIWLILWRGVGRWLGTVAMVLAVGLWMVHPRPDVLISDDGKLIGIEIDGIRTLNRKRGSGFAAERWAENDGFSLDRNIAVEQWPGTLKRGYAEADIDEETRLIWTTDRALDPTICREGAIIVTPNYDTRLTGACQHFTMSDFAINGAVAMTMSPRTILTTRSVRGIRPWSAR